MTFGDSVQVEMSQTQMLSELLMALNELPQEKRSKIWSCKAKIDGLVKEFGEDGMSALAVCGLEAAAKTEHKELMEKING
jgi:hypothetical protein